MLLDTLKCTEKPPQQRVIHPQMSVVPKLRNPALSPGSLNPKGKEACGSDLHTCDFGNVLVPVGKRRELD